MTSILNLNNIVSSAKETSSNSYSDGDGGYPYKTLYLKPGNSASLKTRLLVSAQGSQEIAMKYWTHRDPSTNKIVPCKYRQGKGLKCQVCDAVAQVEAARGITPKGYAEARTIMFLQFVSSSGYDQNDKYPLPEPGETFLLLGPGGVHTSVNKLITTYAEDPANIEKLLIMNDSQQVIFARKDNRADVSVGMSGVQSCTTQEEFETLMNGLPPLDVLFDQVNERDDTDTLRNKLAEDILRSHQLAPGAIMDGSIATQGLPPQPETSAWTAQQAPSQPAAEQQVPLSQQPYAPEQPAPAASFGQPAQPAAQFGVPAQQHTDAPVLAPVQAPENVSDAAAAWTAPAAPQPETVAPAAQFGVPAQQPAQPAAQFAATYAPGDELPASLIPQEADPVPPHLQGTAQQQPAAPSEPAVATAVLGQAPVWGKGNQ